MNHSKQMEANTVASAEIQRQRGRISLLNQARGGLIPGRVADLSLMQLQMRNFSSGKNAEHAAALQPGQCFPKSTSIDIDVPAAAAAIVLERIHEDAVLREFGNVAQQIVSHHLYVRPHARQQYRENSPVHHSKRMIRNDDYRTRGRNSQRI